MFWAALQHENHITQSRSHKVACVSCKIGEVWKTASNAIRGSEEFCRRTLHQVNSYSPLLLSFPTENLEKGDSPFKQRGTIRILDYFQFTRVFLARRVASLLFVVSVCKILLSLTPICSETNTTEPTEKYPARCCHFFFPQCESHRNCVSAQNISSPNG